MNTRYSPTVDYEACVAYYRAGRRINGAARIERYLAAHPEVAERAARDAVNELALAHRFDAILNEPIPPRLLQHTGTVLSPWFTRAGIAAALGLALSMGWWLRGFDVAPPHQTAIPTTFDQQVARLADRQVNAENASLRSQNTPPDLSKDGYTFSSQHFISMHGQTLTAFVYRNAAGKQVTIYAHPQPGTQTAAPTVISPAGVSLARWHVHGTDYALTGDLPPSTLRELAHTATGGAPTTDPQHPRPSAGSAVNTPDSVQPRVSKTPTMPTRPTARNPRPRPRPSGL